MRSPLGVMHRARLLLLSLGLLCLHFASCRAGWVDPDTTEENTFTTGLADGRNYSLVFSDEFEAEGRDFADGADPAWTAETKSDDAQTSTGQGSQHYYNASYVSTNSGYLNLTTTDEETKWRGYNPYKKKYETLHKNFRSAMISTWNKFCFTGGVIEMKAQLPGNPATGGLWPAFWLLGNLGRATYEASTNLVWPWSYDKCNRKLQLAQEISACNGVKHFGLHSHQGRGSTEIDIIEVNAGTVGPRPNPYDKVGLPYVSTTLQVAPGIPEHRPKNEGPVSPRDTWYEGMIFGNKSSQNIHFYGLNVDKTSPQEPVYRSAEQQYTADGISALTKLQKTHFEEDHLYRLEWQPGDEGYLAWYIDNELVLRIGAEVLSPFGTQIPMEPSYLILNTAVSSAWGFPDPCPAGCTCDCYSCQDPDCSCAINDGFCASLPAYFMIDYVRVYQTNDKHQYLGCDPPDFPTRTFIKGHPARYMAGNAKKPLKPVVTGGGHCKSSDDCGHGVCRYPWSVFFSSCSCDDGWKGPNCLVTAKHDDFDYTIHTDWTPRHLTVPLLLRLVVITLALAMVVASYIIGGSKKQKRVSRGRERR
ncbi:unnamed protein product [Chrysoparadoxa australica]